MWSKFMHTWLLSLEEECFIVLINRIIDIGVWVFKKKINQLFILTSTEWNILSLKILAIRTHDDFTLSSQRNNYDKQHSNGVKTAIIHAS